MNLAEQGILLPDGTTMDFEVDQFSKMMLMAGTDEIGYVLAKDAEIAAWEEAHPPRVDTRIRTAPAGRGGDPAEGATRPRGRPGRGGDGRPVSNSGGNRTTAGSRRSFEVARCASVRARRTHAYVQR